MCNINSVTIGSQNIGNIGDFYSWSDNSGNGIISLIDNGQINVNPISSTNYILTVTNDSGCIGTDSIQVNVIQSISLTETHTDVSCNGSCDGSASINASGGVPPYSYLWSDGQTTSTAINLCPGTYTCTVTSEQSNPWQLYYDNDFESSVGSEWNVSNTISYNGSTLLGNFASESVELDLSNIPTHDSIQLIFDLFILDSWDGNGPAFGPDFWNLT